MDEAEDVMGKHALGHVAFSPLPSLQASSLTDLPDLSHCDDKESIVRIPRMFSGSETCEFSTLLPGGWVDLIDAFTFATFINTLNEMLADALNPYHGLFDNIMTNISFQIWPLLFGTHYGRCMKQFRTQLRDFELRVLNPVGFALIPPENTAYQYLECVPYHS